MVGFGTFDGLFGGIDPIEVGGWRALGLSMACLVGLTQLGPADGRWMVEFGTFDGLLGGIDPIRAGG